MSADQMELLRKHWGDFCDADPVPPDFIDLMAAAGYIELRSVTAADLAEPFAAERGIEKGGMLWELTEQGHAAYRDGGPSP